MSDYKAGDWIQRKGSKTGLWFDGEVREVNGDQVTIIIWGWPPEPELVEDLSKLRPIISNIPITIRKGGSVWAVIDGDGTIRINGSIEGSINFDDGSIRKNGSIVGQITFGGLIKKNGSEVGSIKTTSELYRNGSIIGEISHQDGTIRKSGSIYGSIEGFTFTFKELRYAASVLAFFDPEFGY